MIYLSFSLNVQSGQKKKKEPWVSSNDFALCHCCNECVKKFFGFNIIRLVYQNQSIWKYIRSRFQVSFDARLGTSTIGILLPWTRTYARTMETWRSSPWICCIMLTASERLDWTLALISCLSEPSKLTMNVSLTLPHIRAASHTQLHENMESRHSYRIGILHWAYRMTTNTSLHSEPAISISTRIDAFFLVPLYLKLFVEVQ
jgi:hypothetical protein